jgi:hypothetical protein
VVVVDKVRTTHRLWEDEGGVLVELVDISRPEKIQSIAIQNGIDLEDASEATIEEARQTVQRAIEVLGCGPGQGEEHWQTCAYVEALLSWSQGRDLQI